MNPFANRWLGLGVVAALHCASPSRRDETVVPDAGDDGVDAGPDADAGPEPPFCTPTNEMSPNLFSLADPATAEANDDLCAFALAVGDAEVVGLGEAHHDSEGFYRSKTRAARYLVEVLGFRLVAFESPWIPTEGTDDFVVACDGTAEAATSAMEQIVWEADAVRDFLQWLCEFNADAETPVRVIGFDVEQPWHDFALLTRVFGSVADVADAVTGLDACSGVRYEDEYAWFLGDEYAQPMPEADQTNCLAAIGALRDFLDTDAASLGASETELAHTYTALDSLEAWQMEMHGFRNGMGRDGWAARDAGMAAVFERLRELGGNPRTVVWTANSHASRDHASIEIDDIASSNQYEGADSMGRHLAERYGDAYRVFATVARRSTHYAGTAIADLANAEGDVVEVLLGDFGVENVFLDLAPPPSGDPFLAPGATHRMFVDGWYNWMVPAEQFDGLFFMPTSPLAEPM